MKTKTSITRSHAIGLILLSATLMVWSCENSSPDQQAGINPETNDPESGITSKGRIEKSEVLENPDVMPEPQKGLNDFLGFIGNNIQYPEEARKENIEGKVYVGFIVSKDGQIMEVQVEKGLSHGLDEEAVRVVSAYDGKWKPGIKDGEPVNTKMVLPVNYALNAK